MKRRGHIEAKGEMYFSSAIRKIPDFAYLKRQFLNRMVRNEYDGLKVSFDFLTPQQKNAFFAQEGYDLLHYAISIAQDLKALIFICNEISSEVLKTVLRINNFSILTAFLSAQGIMEDYLGIDKIDRQCRIAKFNTLLQIDTDGIVEFVSIELDKPYMSSFIKDDLKIAMGVTTTNVPVYQ